MKLKTTLIALFSCVLVCAQNFREVQLPTPDKLNPLFIGPLVKSTIHYGVTPPNYNGKVIVFNHGYIDLNQGQFLFDNSFYQDTYNEGYQAIFVATTRGKGIWVNGKLLAEAIDIITDRFNVPDIYLVGHSNGGKAAEAAMFQYQKNNKVTKAFALGTPFWGTYLADISQMPWLNWAWSLTGLNEGARTSTTYYCRDVVRPYLDNHPDNQPEKFVVLGASGFYKGSTIAAAAFLLTGGILLPVQGANDGVAPYTSTLRPGATYVFKKNDSRAIFDHLDVGLGQFSWPYIKSYIENRSQKNSATSNSTLYDSKIESDYYIISSENKYDKILLDKNSKYAMAEILHEKPSSEFNIFDKNNTKIKFSKNLSPVKHKTIISITENNVTIKSDSKYAAFVKQNNSIKMSLDKISQSNYPVLKVSFEATKNDINLLVNSKARGVITRTSKIDGTPVKSAPEIIIFEKKGEHYYFDSKNLEEGIYSLFLNGESAGNFKRSIISGFVVGDVKNSLTKTVNNTPTDKPQKSIRLIPNSVKNNASLYIGEQNTTKNLLISIYDTTGKTIKDFKRRIHQHGKVDISEDLKYLSPGIYLLKVNDFKIIRFLKN
ncbi:T9SS type A sorting domain-containing protein [Aquimarina aggregata]|uniref:T9SS type A sorting domain-containing protein n=1 Tax=Aquimarina aggregata TaxID=1642818 RepID=UPI002493B718|nr:T9SS type A sorting domain-containing protein [Aquimarina aggregata]